MAATKPTEKRKPGRPRSARRPELEDAVLANIRLGQSIRRAAMAAGVPHSTVQRWEDDPEFAARAKEAESDRERDWLEKLAGCCDAKSQGAWQRWAWLLERTNPAEYGRKDHLQAEVSNAPQEIKITVVKTRGVGRD